MKNKIGVCLIGCGNVSIPHLNAYMHLPQAEVVACSDIKKETAQKRATQFGISTIYQNYSEALKDNRIDMVDICVPARFHAQTAIESMEAGKHVLCEKPMATTIEEANKMIISANEHQVNLMIGQSTRYIPMFCKAKKQIEKGKIGKPIVIRFATRWFNPIGQWNTEAGKKKYQSQKIGPIVDAGIHAFDWIRWILAKEAKSVAVETRTFPKELPIFTQMNITLDFGEAIGFIELSRMTQKYPSYDRSLSVIGTKGKIEGFDNSVWTHAKKAENLKVKIPSTPTAYIPLIENISYPSEFKSEIDDFLNAIIEKRPVPVSPQDSKAALALALAAQESAEKRKTVYFNK